MRLGFSRFSGTVLTTSIVSVATGSCAILVSVATSSCERLENNHKRVAATAATMPSFCKYLPTRLSERSILAVVSIENPDPVSSKTGVFLPDSKRSITTPLRSGGLRPPSVSASRVSNACSSIGLDSFFMTVPLQRLFHTLSKLLFCSLH